MEIIIQNKQKDFRLNLKQIKITLKRLLYHLKLKNRELSVIFVDDKEISKLNKKYLKRTGPTDVISFPIIDDHLLGDIIISVKTANKNAIEYGGALNEELRRLLIHGLLHLIGYDHIKSSDRAKMQKMEKLLNGITRKCGMSF